MVYYDGEHCSDIDYWLFAAFGEFEEEPCIMHPEMNCYYNSIYNNVVKPNAPLHYDPVTGRPYIECIVNDYHDIITRENTGGEPSVEARFHTVNVAYGLILNSN